MSTDSTVKTFFNSPQFAVVGASTNPAKFGHKGKVPGGPLKLPLSSPVTRHLSSPIAPQRSPDFGCKRDQQLRNPSGRFMHIEYDIALTTSRLTL